MKVKDWIELSSIIILVYWIFDIVGIGCPIKYLTGISCAGCGMTRAWLSVLKLDFSMAFYYHPLFFIPPIAMVVILLKYNVFELPSSLHFSKKTASRVYHYILIFIILLFITIYFIRIINPNDSIVVIDIKNSAIWRLLRKVV